MIAKGDLKISAGGEILNICAQVVGKSVLINSSDKVVTVPLELYNEVIRAGEYHYESYKGAKFIKPKIIATDEKKGSGTLNGGQNSPDQAFDTIVKSVELDTRSEESKCSKTYMSEERQSIQCKSLNYNTLLLIEKEVARLENESGSVVILGKKGV